ncbi:MAG: hypothetical protein E6J12_12515 [Chloroflexi bacterium]|nr:MAG: hypothetical protein E6J12_12515 [Chloroflexota bacterium]
MRERAAEAMNPEIGRMGDAGPARVSRSEPQMSVGTSEAAAGELNPEGIADRTTVGVFFSQAARYGDRPLVHYKVGDTWKAQTWADMKRDVLAVASALVDAGVQPGDSVILMSPNRLEWLYCDLGIQAAGAVTVPIYSGTPAETAKKIVANCEAVLAITSGTELAATFEVGGPLKRIVTIDADVAAWVVRRQKQLPEVAARLARIKPDDICTIVYTSGTTGDPKGVELAHRCLVDISRAILKVFPLLGVRAHQRHLHRHAVRRAGLDLERSGSPRR